MRIGAVLAVALRFGADYGGPPNSNGYSYDANCDINDDLKIRIDDVLAATQHFGQGARASDTTGSHSLQKKACINSE